MTNMNSKPTDSNPAVAHPKPEAVVPKVDAAKHESATPAPATKV